MTRASAPTRLSLTSLARAEPGHARLGSAPTTEAIVAALQPFSIAVVAGHRTNPVSLAWV